MSFIVDYAEGLQEIRTRLSDNTLINDPTNYSKLTGTIDFLLNPALNSSEIQTKMMESSEKSQYRPVQVKYQPQWGDEDLLTDDASVVCDPNNQRRWEIDTYNADLFAYNKFTLEENYLRQVLEDGESIRGSALEQGILKSMRICRESISSQLLAGLVSNIGTNPAQNAAAGAYTDVQMLNSDGGADVVNFDFIVNDLEENFMKGPVAIIGQGGNSNSNKYFNRLAVGNLNTNAGVDVAEIANQFGMLYFKDQSVTANLGAADRVLAVYPGLSQMYGYNLYRGDTVIQSTDHVLHMTMPDPIYPILWDVKVKYDENCSTGNGLEGKWVVHVFKYFGLFTTPTAAFGGVYDDLAGFNGVLGYNITSA